jgi:integrase
MATTPGVKKRGAKWQATYRGPDGRERTRSFTLKGDAKKWIEDERSKINRGAWIDARSGRATLREFADPWLDRQLNLAVRTKELYRYLLDKHTLPTFGETSLGALRPSMIEAWHGQLAQAHPSTAAKSYRLLSQIMRAAVRDKLIHESPCQLPGGGKESAAERPVASIAEVDAIAGAMPAHLQLAVLLAAWCQLRRGELLGLRRRDVDLLHATVTVAVTRVKMMSGEMIDKAPKSDAGVRTLAVPPHVVPILVEHLERFVEIDASALVFTGLLGEPLRVRQLDGAWQRARATIGRSDLHFHDLRHSGLTWSAATGATVAELMRRAGHASPTAALRYQHATEDRDRVLADALSELVPLAKVLRPADFSRTWGASDDAAAREAL